jgi:hypothetical protein
VRRDSGGWLAHDLRWQRLSVHPAHHGGMAYETAEREDPCEEVGMRSLRNAQRPGNAVNGDEKNSRSIFRGDPLDRYLPSDAKNRSANIFQVEAF